jgi:hypothetical protein
MSPISSQNNKGEKNKTNPTKEKNQKCDFLKTTKFE